MPKEPTVDPALASLFASSSGPVVVPARPSRAVTSVKKSLRAPVAQVSQSSDDESEDEAEISSGSDTPEIDVELEQSGSRPRKRRRLSQEDDLEAAYLDRLVREEQKEDLLRSRKTKRESVPARENGDEDDSASSASNDLEDLSDIEVDDGIPQHESVTKPSANYDKTRRTVFLGNVSTEAIKSKVERKKLEAHLKSALDADTKEKIESLRFRSTAFSMDAGPKRAAYATKELMDETTKCTNAYVVFNTESAAKKIAKKLNGTTILDRHLHTDWLAHPTAIDHKRCVFVGNLNFVDLETNIDMNENGGLPKRRPRAKEPADAEEGLWRAFSKCGPVESVRVVRDKATRVGKGFAYVQFSDEVGAEKALALDGKKFPPMLPRLLRVSRAKKVLKKDLKRKRDDDRNGRGQRGMNGTKRGPGGQIVKRKKLDGVVFEGYRASADKGMKFKSKGKKKSGVRPGGRSSKRGAAFKASGGKKNRDSK